MKKKGDVQLLDATVRDGGLVNDFFFTDDFIKAVYEANSSAGVDYMEFGYRADKKLFDPEKYGIWKYASDDDIRRIVGETKKDIGISVMCDVGRCDYKNDIHKKNESPVDLIRVATYIDTMRECLDIIEFASKQGYEVTCNLMAVSKSSESQLKAALELLASSPVMCVYVVDSYGALYPKQIQRIVEYFIEKLSPAGKMTGIHAHNNQQCAFANTIEAYDSGAELLDATAYGMGRGAGNCHMEALLGYLSGSKYHVEPLLDLVQNQMVPLKAKGINWGYNTSYMLTGLTNNHPLAAITATKDNETDYKKQYYLLLDK